MKPIYKEKKFKNHKEFEKWLNKTTYKVVSFKDYGQDLLKIYIAKNGEIIHCNLQAFIYNGSFVNMDKLRIGLPVEIFKNGSWLKMNKLIIQEIK